MSTGPASHDGDAEVIQPRAETAGAEAQLDDAPGRGLRHHRQRTTVAQAHHCPAEASQRGPGRKPPHCAGE